MDDKAISISDDSKETSWTKTVKNADGTSVTERVEKVTNGYIKTICYEGNSENDYKYSEEKSIHENNPLYEKSTVEKLEEIFKNFM